MHQDKFFKILNKELSILIYIVVFGAFFVCKNAFADNVFRVTEYKINSASGFSGTNYELTLNQNLAENHFVLVNGAATGNINRGSNSSYIRVSSLPTGINKSLGVSSGLNKIGLSRYSTSSANWVGVVTVVECLIDCENNGFKTLDILSLPANGSTASGTITSGQSWTNVNKIVPFGGAFGAGSNVQYDGAYATNFFHPAWLRLYPSGTNQINWQRYNAGNRGLITSTNTIYVIEWGSAWNVQRVNVSGTNGRNGANRTDAYNTGTISSVARLNTWVWGTGYSTTETCGAGAEGVLLTLGNGVNKNTTESRVAIGSEISGSTRSFDVYIMSHQNLNVDYVFKADNTTTSITTTSANSGNRMSQVWVGSSLTSNDYPANILTSRYQSNTSILLEREYSSSSFPACIQGINFQNIQYTPASSLNQKHYRWRDDSGNTNESLGWISNEDTNFGMATKSQIYRLRLYLANEGESQSSGISYKIQYGQKISTCSNITNWIDIGTDNKFEILNSSKITNGENTFNILANIENYGFVSGQAYDTTNTTNTLGPIARNNFTEIEFGLAATVNSQNGDYCFRLYNSLSNKVLDVYEKYPELSIGCFIMQDYYRWYENLDSTTPTTPISQENNQAYVNSNNPIRLRTNLFVTFSNLLQSSEQFKVQYSKSQTNDWNDVANPSNINWWDNNYKYRRKINFGTNHSLLATYYTASLNMNTTVASLQNGNDIRIIFQKNTGENIELDRIGDVWNNTNTTINFKLISNINANLNEPTDGSYYVYYGNGLAQNPPQNKSKIYSIFDDFDDNKLDPSWLNIDNDKVIETSFTENNETLNINGGGVDIWKTTDDYSGIYQRVSGDFEAILKIISQENTNSYANTGLMLKNDITSTKSNNGYFVAVTTMTDGYLAAWDSNNDGYIDKTTSYAGAPTAWPSCLKVIKTGTSMASYYSKDCTTFNLISTQSISSATILQDLGIFQLSMTNNILSLSKIDYFWLKTKVANSEETTLSTLETKGSDWEFYDNPSLGNNSFLSSSLLSNTNIQQTYQESNPTLLNPNQININQRAEWDFSLSPKYSQKSSYFFRLIKANNSELTEYAYYPKITIDKILEQSNFRWFKNTNSLIPQESLSNENQEARLYSSQPIRLRMNLRVDNWNLEINSELFRLQYSKSINENIWEDVGANKDWEFYDNPSLGNNSFLSSSLLSNTNIQQTYQESNPTLLNPNQININQRAEWDFALKPGINVSNTTYYFRLIKNNGGILDSYINYPKISIDLSAKFDQKVYRFFNNENSQEVGIPLANQNTPIVLSPGSNFRLKIILNNKNNILLQNKGHFKLQFVDKGTGTCANPIGGSPSAYTNITNSTAIAFKENSIVQDGNILIPSTQDPVFTGDIKNQTYKETHSFSNSVSDILEGENGKWEFSLFDNGVQLGRSYCFRVVNVDDSLLETYSNFPEIKVASGALTIDIVDTNGVSILNPEFNLQSISFNFNTQNVSGYFGVNNKKIRINNTTSNPLWSLTLSANTGNTALWQTSNNLYYDFNDPMADTNDGTDEDIYGGQMFVDSSTGLITPEAGCNYNGIILNNEDYFNEGIRDTLTLASSSSTSQINCYWDITGMRINQSVPRQQGPGNYYIDMTLTVMAN